MTIRTIAVFFWACLIATAAIAGEQHRTQIKIAVDGDEHQFIEIDSDASGDVIVKKEINETN